jgi:Lsr2
MRGAMRGSVTSGRALGLVVVPPTGGPTLVKQWARANGYQVRDRGRIPTAVLDAFDSAN